MSRVTSHAQQPWKLWNAYADRFIDRQGRVIDPQGNSRTTSEGQSYALFFALAANDRARFDRVLGWTQANLAQGDLSAHLPAWLWGRTGNGAWTVLDPSSAADSDAWIAYSLCEAGRLWKAPAYANTGRAILAHMAASEVADLPSFGPMLLPGPNGFEHRGTYVLNPSYLPVFLFERFAQIDPAGPWRMISAGIPRLIEQSSRQGYAMDWVSYTPGNGFQPSPPDPDARPPLIPLGSYDAIRVYLWAGMMNPAGGARAALLKAVPGMSAYLAGHDAPPEKIDASGNPLSNAGGAGFSAALLPYLRAIPGDAKILTAQTARLDAQKDSTTGLYGKELTYYEQNLALFGTGFIDARFRFGPGGELKVGWTHS
jgi:endoglucanase